MTFDLQLCFAKKPADNWTPREKSPAARLLEFRFDFDAESMDYGRLRRRFGFGWPRPLSLLPRMRRVLVKPQKDEHDDNGDDD